MAQHEVVVVGAGIIGLSSAIHVQESCPDCHVTVIADMFSPDTTSDECGGFWYPFRMSDTDPELISDTAMSTYRYLKQLALSPQAPSVGVSLLTGYFFAQTDDLEQDLIWTIADGVRRLTPAELQSYPGFRVGFAFDSWVLNVTIYQAWMTSRFIANGGKFIKRKIQSLSELAGRYDVAVVCCGMGAASLLNDTQMYPLRGQIIRVEAPWIKHVYGFRRQNGERSYVHPNIKWVTVGGTTQEGDWNTEVDEELDKKIWERAVQVMPQLTHAKKIKSWAGLRPCRTKLRLETEVIGHGSHELRIVHNYGHGGSGVTIHWGCAKIAADMVKDLLTRKPITSPSTSGRTHALSHKL